MKYGNSMNVFFGKNVFYYSSAGKVHGYGGKVKFSKKNDFDFHKEYLHVFFQ